MVNRRLLKWSRELAYERPFDSFGCGHGSDLKEEVKREKEGKVKKKGWKMGNIIENMYITLLYVVHSMGLLCAYPNTSRRPMLLFGIGERERENTFQIEYYCIIFALHSIVFSLSLSLPFLLFPTEHSHYGSFRMQPFPICFSIILLFSSAKHFIQCLLFNFSRIAYKSIWPYIVYCTLYYNNF